jgi:uncharacterized protein (TIGR00725 family)
MDCGSRLAAAGFTVATGGYGGIMEAACRGAAEAGGATIGVTAPTVFPERAGANQWVQREIAADDLVHRIGILASIAAGYVAMPGSLGTLAELVMAWNLAFVAPFSGTACRPIVAVGDTWGRIVPELTAQLQTDGAYVEIAPSVEDAVSYMVAAFR